jgi:hypothetical protein
VYSAVGGVLSWDEFARAAELPSAFLVDNLDELTSPGVPLLVTLAAGALMALLSAAVRAPYFRAIVGLGYPLSPRSRGELARLTLFYLLYYAFFWLIPLAVPDEPLLTIVAAATLIVGALAMFADYVVVFEERGPIQAIAQSFHLVRRGWVAALGVFLLASLLLSALQLMYSDFYEGSDGVFVLFPFTEILIRAFLVMVGDVFLIYVYRYLARG